MLAVPVAIGACGLLLAAHTYTLRQKLDMPVELASQDPEEKLAFMGTMGHISQRPWTDTRGRFRSVEVTTDALEQQWARKLEEANQRGCPASYNPGDYQSGDGTLPLHFIERTRKFEALGAGKVAPQGHYSNSEALSDSPAYSGPGSHNSILPHVLLATALFGLLVMRR